MCELVAALEADGALVRQGGMVEIAVAEELPSPPVTILHRLSFLPADVLELLGFASVLGTAFSARDLALLTGRSVAEPVAPLRSAQPAGVLAERGDRLEFRHELVRDALYEDMPPSVRRDLHRELATNTLAMAAAAGGRFAEAAELLAPSVRRVEEIGTRAAHDARSHMLLGLMLARLDRLEEASATIQRGRRAAETVGIADALPVYHYQAAYVAFAAGRLDDALAELAAHAQLAEQMAIGWRLPAESVRALIALHRDGVIAAEQHVAEAEREAGAAPFEAGLLALARALVAEAAGDARPALPALADAFAAAATLQPVIGPELARLAGGGRGGARRRGACEAPGGAAVDRDGA